MTSARLAASWCYGDIAVPDEKGATHIGDLQDDIAQGRSDRLAYFAFDLLHLDGRDLRG
jgi:bifunctional non-homologous end joining protein LigD